MHLKEDSESTIKELTDTVFRLEGSVYVRALLRKSKAEWNLEALDIAITLFSRLEFKGIDIVTED